jgi:hypothetical protein
VGFTLIGYSTKLHTQAERKGKEKKIHVPRYINYLHGWPCGAAQATAKTQHGTKYRRTQTGRQRARVMAMSGPASQPRRLGRVPKTCSREAKGNPKAIQRQCTNQATCPRARPAGRNEMRYPWLCHARDPIIVTFLTCPHLSVVRFKEKKKNTLHQSGGASDAQKGTSLPGSCK